MPQILQTGSKNFNTENWEVYHPNGKHMFTCGERKAEWYLSKELAIQIDKHKIKLTFEPKGYGFSDGEIFGLAGRIIQCVVTGENEGLQRHHIIPYCYRSHFPEEYKSKNHHDVVLVTYGIHEIYELEASKFKNQLAKEYDIRTLNELNLEYTKVLCEYSNEKIKMISKFNAIFTSYGHIPSDVVVNNLKLVSMLTGISFKKLKLLNYMQLYKLYRHLKSIHEDEFNELKRKNKTKFDHGYHLVKKLNTHKKIEGFVRRWRQHFLDSMKPKFMPEGWGVNFRCKVEL